MSPADIASAAADLFDAGNTSLAIYLTVLSGYLLVSHTTGRTLGRPQVLFISVMFVVFSAVLALTSFSLWQAAIDFTATHSDTDSPIIRVGSYVLFAVQLLAIVGALIFMLASRKKRSSDAPK